MELIALILALLAVLGALGAGVVSYYAYQASQKTVDRIGLATVPGLDAATNRITYLETVSSPDAVLTRLSAVEVSALTWDEVQPHLDEHYQLREDAKKAIKKLEEELEKVKGGVIDETKLETALGEFATVLGSGVDTKIEDAIAAIPKGSITPPFVPQSEKLTKVVKSLFECLQIISQGMPSASRSSIEGEIHKIENRGVAEKEALQQARSDSQKGLHAAEIELMRLKDELLPEQVSNERATTHVESIMPDASYADKGVEFERYKTEVYPEMKDAQDKAVKEASESVATLTTELTTARDEQSAFERDFHRTPEESARLRELQTQLESIKSFEFSMARAKRNLPVTPSCKTLSPPPSISPEAHIPAPPLPMSESASYFPADEADVKDAPDSVDVAAVQNLSSDSVVDDQDGRFCPYCERKAPPGYKHCGGCGKKLP